MSMGVEEHKEVRTWARNARGLGSHLTSLRQGQCSNPKGIVGELRQHEWAGER